MEAGPTPQASELIALQAQGFRTQQLSRWAYLYTLNVAVANNTTFPAILPIEQDAEFLIKSFTGSCYGPCDVNGVRSINASTDFPLAGTAVPSGATLPAVADRGLMLKITDTGAGRELTYGFVSAETILSPGYGVARTIPQPFEYYTLRNSKIQFDIRNRDTTAGLYHFISLTFYGFKFNAPQ